VSSSHAQTVKLQVLAAKVVSLKPTWSKNLDSADNKATATEVVQRAAADSATAANTIA
jgi:hypothetical protein